MNEVSCIVSVYNKKFLLQYKLEDFALFDNVVHINAADNQLPLGESVF